MQKITGHDCFGKPSYSSLEDCPFYEAHKRNAAKNRQLGEWLQERLREAEPLNEPAEEPEVVIGLPVPRFVPPTWGELAIFMVVVLAMTLGGLYTAKKGDESVQRYAAAHVRGGGQ